MEQNDFFELARDLVQCLGGPPLSRIPFSAPDITGYMNRHLQGILSAEHTRPEFVSVFDKLRPNQLYLISSRIEDCFLAFLEPDGRYLWIAGPCLSEPLTDEALARLLRKNARGGEAGPYLEHYYKGLPFVRGDTLSDLGRILGARFYGELAEQWKLQRLSPEAPSQPDLVEHDGTLLAMRILERRYDTTSVLFSAVREGNFALACKCYHPLFLEISQIKRNPDPIRNAQNLCIIMNSMLRRVVQEQGVHPYLLDKVSGKIGVKIESIHSYSKLEELGLEILRTYCQLIQEQLFPNCKPLIREAVTYTVNQLSAPLSVKDVAGALSVNPDYFSHLFRQETGMRFTEFLNRQRCRQAGVLLKDTEMSIRDVALASGYVNINYFSAQFKRQMGETPRQYRKSH